MEKNHNFQTWIHNFLRFVRFISNNFENGLLEQIIIDKYTVGNLNNIDIYEDICDPYPGLDALTLQISYQTLWNNTCTFENDH